MDAGSLVVLSGIGAGALAFGYLAIRNSPAAIGGVLLLWILTVPLRDSLELAFTLGSTQMFVLDIAATVLLIIGVARVLSAGVGGLASGLLLALVGLLFWHTARGIEEFGAATAVNSSRSWFYLLAAALYSATLPEGWSRRSWRLFVAGGMALVAVAVPYFLLTGIGAASEFVDQGGELVATRPVAASGALIALQAAVVGVAIGWPSRRSALGVALAAGAIVVLMQHRTIWAAALIVAVSAFFWWSLHQRGEDKKTVFAATGILIIALPFAGLAFASTGPLVESATEVTASNSTFVWRIEGWEQLIEARTSASNIATGDPAGADLSRTLNGELVERSPHNGFVDAFVRFGAPGVILIAWLGALLWVRRHEIADRVGLSPLAVSLILATQLVYAMAYSLGVIQGLIIGAFVGGAAARQLARDPAAELFTAPAAGAAAR